MSLLLIEKSRETEGGFPCQFLRFSTKGREVMIEEETRSCKICNGEIEQDNPADICYSCQSIMSNMNLGVF